jgi:hypothetical protein
MTISVLATPALVWPAAIWAALILAASSANDFRGMAAHNGNASAAQTIDSAFMRMFSG